MQDTLDRAAALDALGRVGTALADPTRRQILLRLTAGSGYPAELAESLGVGRTKMSNHLTCLRGCGLVSATREGRKVRYDLTSVELSRIILELARLPLAVDASHHDLDGRS